MDVSNKRQSKALQKLKALVSRFNCMRMAYPKAVSATKKQANAEKTSSGAYNSHQQHVFTIACPLRMASCYVSRADPFRRGISVDGVDLPSTARSGPDNLTPRATAQTESKQPLVVDIPKEDTVAFVKLTPTVDNQASPWRLPLVSSPDTGIPRARRYDVPCHGAATHTH